MNVLPLPTSDAGGAPKSHCVHHPCFSWASASGLGFLVLLFDLALCTDPSDSYFGGSGAKFTTRGEDCPDDSGVERPEDPFIADLRLGVDDVLESVDDGCEMLEEVLGVGGRSETCCVRPSYCEASRITSGILGEGVISAVSFGGLRPTLRLRFAALVGIIDGRSPVALCLP